MSNKSVNISNRFIESVEKNRFNLISGFIYILVLGLLRTSLEEQLLTGALTSQDKFGPTWPFSVYIYAHTIAFYFAVFLIGVTILHILTREKVRKVANVVFCGFWIIIIPPILDVFLFGSTKVYLIPDPNDLSNWLSAALFFKIPAGLSTGVHVQFAILYSLCALYVFIKTRSILRALLVIVVLQWTPTLVFGALFLLFIKGSILYPFPGGITIDSFALLCFIYFTSLSILLSTLLVHRTNKKTVLSIFKNLRPYRSSLFMMLVFIGVIVASPPTLDSYTFTFLEFEGFLRLALSIFSVFFVWQFTVVINDIFDEKIDRMSNAQRPLVMGTVTRPQYIGLGIMFGILSIGAAFLVGRIALMVIAAFIISAIVYSCPPLRLRNYLWSTCFIGLWTTSAYLLGFFTVKTSLSALTTQPLMIGAMIFMALTIGPVIKDFKDYEGDKRYNVKTIFTEYGLEKGMKIASILLTITFLIPIVLFHELLDVVLFAFMCLVANISFRKYKSTQEIFIFAFLILIYCVLRITGIL